METFLKIKDISKSFERKKALDEVSFDVPKGKIFGLLGPNGAGKTTLIRIINRIISPDKGQVFFNGNELKAENLQEIGYLPEERGLYRKMKVGEQILFFAKLKGMNSVDAKKAADFWMKRLKIKSWYNDKVETLSKGMQQKIQFIITVLHNPKLLIFDEPFTGFDPINVDLIKKQILWLKEQGTTIIFSTHNMASVEEICDRILLINEGQKILEGELTEIKNRFFEQIYEVVVDKNFDIEALNSYDILEKEAQNKILRLKIKLDGHNKSELIKMLAEKGNLQSFNPIVPKLHDIFVETVEKTKKNDNNE